MTRDGIVASGSAYRHTAHLLNREPQCNLGESFQPPHACFVTPKVGA